MDQRFSDYLTQYKKNYTFIETECQKSEVCSIKITVTLYEYDTEAEHRDRADILLEKDGLRYECRALSVPDGISFPLR